MPVNICSRCSNDILDLAKMEAGAEQLSLAPARIGELVQGVLDIKAEDARSKQLTLRTDVDNRLAYAYLLDEPRVRQVLLNLVGNAIKFTPQGGVTLRVERLEAGPQSDLLRFSVQDTGIGLAPEHASRIFEPFFQVDSSTSRRYEGAGLGLAICRRLVEIMCGEIGVESRPGGRREFLVQRLAGTPPDDGRQRHALAHATDQQPDAPCPAGRG